MAAGVGVAVGGGGQQLVRVRAGPSRHRVILPTTDHVSGRGGVTVKSLGASFASAAANAILPRWLCGQASCRPSRNGRTLAAGNDTTPSDHQLAGATRRTGP